MSNPTKPQPTKATEATTATKDAERLEAERMAVDLAARLGRQVGQSGHQAGPEAEDPVAAAARIGALSDHELRLELYRLRRSVESAESGDSASSRGPSPAQKRTQEMLVARCRRLAQPNPSISTSSPARSDEELLDELADVGITVAEDGLLEVDRITDQVHWLAGAKPEIPVAMYHHTSSALLDAFRAEGLKIGKPTNFFNTQQGVYVSTIQAGPPVSVYSRRAALVHGGVPITLRVRRKLSEIKPDPDDADLAWAQGRQYITPSVPPEDIMWDAEEKRAEAKPVVTTPAATPSAPARKMRPR